MAEPKIITKKILPAYFAAVAAGVKNFELRKDEDGARINDVLILQEYKNGEYTGQWELRRIKYILRDVPEYGLQPGYCILGW